MPTPFWLNGPHSVNVGNDMKVCFPQVHVAGGALSKHTRGQLVDLIEEMNVLVRQFAGVGPNDGPFDYCRSRAEIIAEE